MGNRILKTGFLSIAAASVLTTSAFADISTKVTHSNTGVLDKNGGKKEVFQINIANTDSDYSYLEKFTIDINSTIPDVSFLKQIAIYRGNTQAANLIKAFPVQDTDTDSTAGISTVLDLTEVAQEKTRFLNEGSNPT
ncbi:MAG TPA: hypothetical protein EYG60_03360, partial [Campylobacterales bacterium]|nr:hypothetical protein [Campylobacterales bacterium]